MFTFVSVLGSIIAILAYLGLERGYFAASLKPMYAMNLAATALLSISLIGEFNTGTAIMQIFFGAISLKGLLTKEAPVVLT